MQWAHYPNIHFGLNSGREGGKNKLVDEAVVAAAAVAPKKIQGFYWSMPIERSALVDQLAGRVWKN